MMSTPASHGAVIVRPYGPRDRAAVREICCQAAREQPDPLYHEDGELAPRLLADYYLDADPDCCFVATIDGRVVGYTVGCKDTRAYLRARRRRLLPRATVRIAVNVVTVRYRRRATYRALWWHLRARLGPRRSRPLPRPLLTHPAHSHLNVARGHRGRGIGERLSEVLHDHLRACGIAGLHATVVEPPDDDAMSRFLCTRRGHVIQAIRAHEVLRGITGRAYQLKLLACDLDREVRNAHVHPEGVAAAQCAGE